MANTVPAGFYIDNSEFDGDEEVHGFIGKCTYQAADHVFMGATTYLSKLEGQLPILDVPCEAPNTMNIKKTGSTDDSNCSSSSSSSEGSAVSNATTMTADDDAAMILSTIRTPREVFLTTAMRVACGMNSQLLDLTLRNVGIRLTPTFMESLYWLCLCDCRQKGQKYTYCKICAVTICDSCRYTIFDHCIETTEELPRSQMLSHCKIRFFCPNPDCDDGSEGTTELCHCDNDLASASIGSHCETCLMEVLRQLIPGNSTPLHMRDLWSIPTYFCSCGQVADLDISPTCRLCHGKCSVPATNTPEIGGRKYFVYPQGPPRFMNAKRDIIKRFSAIDS